MFLIVCVYLQGLIITYVFQSAYLCDGRFCCFLFGDLRREMGFRFVVIGRIDNHYEKKYANMI
jgi:hypothetical protein